MMRFTVDQDSGTSIYLQLKDQILYAISVGELRPGDALPSIRKLEAELGVNRNTVRRAYQELQSEGTLTIRQGRKAEVAAKPPRSRQRTSGSRAELLAHRMVRDAEAEGCDGIGFISVFEQAAADHDTRYPKCVFIECSQYQADDFAGVTGTVWGRRVVGIDLNRLHEDVELLPPSTRYVLTTHWHLAQVQRLLRRRVKGVQDVKVQLSQTFYEGVRRVRGLKTGLILRDAESIAGYRELVRQHGKVKGDVPVALMGEPVARTLMDTLEGVIYTTPCRGFVAENAPSHLVMQELLYEPIPDDLVRVKEDIFHV